MHDQWPDRRPDTTPGQDSQPKSGFTLVETLIAFTILAVSMVVLLQSFTSGLRSLDTAGSYARAALIARSKLAEFGTVRPLESGEHSGELDDRFTWRTVVEPYESVESAGRVIGQDIVPYRVEVTVAWGGRREVTLSTLRLGNDE